MWTIFCARATLAAFLAAVPGQGAWAQVAERAASAPAPIGAPALAAPALSAAPLTAPALSMAPAPSAALVPAAAPALSVPAAEGAAVPAAAAEAAAAAPTASSALSAAAADVSAFSAPRASDGSARAGAARAFDASAARPADADAAVFGAASAEGAPALARASSFRAAAPRAVPAAPRWTERAKSYLPAALVVTGGAVVGWALQHFGVAPGSAAAPLAMLAGILTPGNAGGKPTAAEKSRLYGDMRENQQAGELLTPAAIAQYGMKFGWTAEKSERVADALADEDSLARLSEGHYLFVDIEERSSGTYGIDEQDLANASAQAALHLLNHPSDERFKQLAGALAALGESLRLIPDSQFEYRMELISLYRNVALELARGIADTYWQLVREKKGDADQDTVRARGLRDLFDDIHYDGGRATHPLSPLAKTGMLALLQRAPLKQNALDTPAGEQIAVGMERLKSFLSGGSVPAYGSAPVAPQRPVLSLPAPARPAGLLAGPAGSAAPAPEPAKPAGFKALDKDKFKTLLEFGVDLTQKASEGKTRPLIGRKAEIRQIEKTLLRVEKNNPLVIGEKGVGKTAIVGGLAKMIVDGEIPELAGKNIIKLDMTKIVAGTKYRGEFEERMKKIIEEAAKSNGQVILFIDEIHTIVGAGAASGSQDASQILKESLADGSISLIGATTLEEFRKIEKDGALMRRFNPVKLLPPTKAEAEEILEGIKSIYEKKHNVQIPTETVKSAVSLASRYVTDRALPDSALDLMDDASAEVELKASEAKKAGREDATRTVTSEDIAWEIELRTGVPAGKLSADKKTALKSLPGELKGQVIGQDHAVAAVARAVQRGELGYRDPKQPIGAFVFLGPTGVGKTELARALAKIKFGSEKNMLRLDMSEYQEKHSVSRLISAPPGYVGHDEGGQLTEPIRRNPYQVILLDEIEKAHPDVFDVLLQVLEDGRLTDSSGRVVDFSNTIIIMTSNIGGSVSGADARDQTIHHGPDGDYRMEGMGFGAKWVKVGGETDGGAPSADRRAHYLKEFKAKYRPEFVNRVGEDGVIVFNELTERAKLEQILDLRLAALQRQLAEKRLTVELTTAAREAALTKALANKQYGARPIKQLVDRSINDALSDAELDGRISDGDRVIVDWDAAAGSFRADKAP
jgi:ATP-dependent Clp protease ATP-binding subunit ClpC